MVPIFITTILVFGGGIVPDVDLPKLEAMGVGAIFTPGTSTQDVVSYLKRAAARAA